MCAHVGHTQNVWPTPESTLADGMPCNWGCVTPEGTFDWCQIQTVINPGPKHKQLQAAYCCWYTTRTLQV